jgi:antitoxin component YwqK of YwqJK toxin-antitoxin module
MKQFLLLKRSKVEQLPMKHLILLLFLGLGTGLSAQELLGQEFWPDGTLRATRYAEGGRIHFITYHENGRVKEVGCFHHGRRDGVWKQYTDTGALVTQAGFKDGERQGVWEFRTEADEPLGQLTYHNGELRHGKQYDPAGLLAALRTY